MAGKKKKIDFDAPPLAEVVCGVQFEMLPNFTVGHVGKLWNLYEQRYQESREQPTLLCPIEPMPGEIPTHQLFPTLMPRTIFAAKDQTALLQIQRDGFYYNWQKTGPKDAYPRYEKVVERFEKEFGIFLSFLQQHDLGELKPLQFELTYLNEIPLPDDTSRILRDSFWHDSGKRYLHDPETINLNASFLLEEGLLGRLHTNFRNISKNNGEHVYHWSLVVRGCTKPRENTSVANMREWFDNAREYIVNGFADLADLDFQKKQWGRKQ